MSYSIYRMFRHESQWQIRPVTSLIAAAVALGSRQLMAVQRLTSRNVNTPTCPDALGYDGFPARLIGSQPGQLGG